MEVNQPHAHTRLRLDKSDPIDAEAAARKVLDGRLSTQLKRTTSAIGAIRVLRVARESAVKARSAALVQFQDLVTTAPADLRESLASRGTRANVTLASSWRPDGARLDDPTQATKMALRMIARRVHALDEEIVVADEQLRRLVEGVAPTLVTRLGIGTQHAAQLLVTAGENIERLTSEAAFARLRYDQWTIDYTAHRQAEGLSKKDVLRCLKWFIAREVFHDLLTDLGQKGT